MATDTKEARALAKTADDGEASRDGLQEFRAQSSGLPVGEGVPGGGLVAVGGGAPGVWVGVAAGGASVMRLSDRVGAQSSGVAVGEGVPGVFPNLSLLANTFGNNL